KRFKASRCEAASPWSPTARFASKSLPITSNDSISGASSRSLSAVVLSTASHRNGCVTSITPTASATNSKSTYSRSPTYAPCKIPVTQHIQHGRGAHPDPSHWETWHSAACTHTTGSMMKLARMKNVRAIGTPEPAPFIADDLPDSREKLL